METIYGIIGVANTTLVNEAGQREIFDAINEMEARYIEERQLIESILVEEETTERTERYALPSSGTMQEMGEGDRPGATKTGGFVEVAYDFRLYGDQTAWTRVALATMSAGDAEKARIAKELANANTRRIMMLRHIFNNANESVSDRKGTLVIRRLANGDTQPDGTPTLYPPRQGELEMAEENHYLVSGYAAADISDTNNPTETIAGHLKHHFANNKLVVFINAAQTPKVKALTNFTERTAEGVILGANSDQVDESYLENLPGDFLGVIDGVIVQEWSAIPAGYMFGQNLLAAPPLKRRVHEAEEMRGFRLVAMQSEYPLLEAYWQDGFGYGVANRLNGVVLQLKASGTYEVPAVYAF